MFAAGPGIVEMIIWAWILVLSLGGCLAIFSGADVTAGLASLVVASILLMLAKLLRVAEACLAALRSMND